MDAGADPPEASAAATALWALGYRHLIPVRRKVPWDVTTGRPLPSWQSFSCDESVLGVMFAPPVTGVGVNLGREGVIDVDCDTPEAVHAARLLLPPTATFGRASSPASHYIYRPRGGGIATAKYQVLALRELGFDGDTRRQAMLVELRCQGMQTVFPGSLWIDRDDETHVERVAWGGSTTLAEVDADELRRTVGELAAAALLARCWPHTESHCRHEFSLPLAGWLLRAGLPEKNVRRLIEVAARVVADEEFGDRVRSVFTTVRRHRDGGRVTGGVRLGEYLPPVAFDRLRVWLELPDRPRLSPVTAREPGEDDVDEIDGRTGVERPARFRILTGDEILNMPAPLWTVHRLIESESLAVLYGPPGGGKTFIAIDLALHIAAGIAWHGRPVRQGPVIYIAAEGGVGLSIRCRAWCERHQRELPPDFGLIVEAPDLFGSDEDLKLIIASIRAKLGARDPVLIFVDTLARSMVGGEENSNTDMGVVIARCSQLQREFHAAVCLVHHTTKADAGRERGATALRGAADTMLLVTGDKPAMFLVTDKQKNAREGDPVSLELVAVELPGVDGGSCVVLAAKAGDRPQVAGRYAEIAFDILVNQFHGKVSWSMWKGAFLAETGRKDSTFYRAHRALARAKRIQKDGCYWVAAAGS